MINDELRLNLGAAVRKYEGFVSVDLVPPADQIVDLSGPWPWADSSVAEVIAYDVCEHIGDCDHAQFWACSKCSEYRFTLEMNQNWNDFARRHPLGRIHFMNELWRVLRSGGIARIETPNASRGSGYYQDPTHVSPWCLSSFKYFEEGAFARQRLGDAYGIVARFKVRELSERQTPGEDPREIAFKITACLEAVK